MANLLFYDLSRFHLVAEKICMNYDTNQLRNYVKMSANKLIQGPLKISVCPLSLIQRTPNGMQFGEGTQSSMENYQFCQFASSLDDLSCPFWWPFHLVGSMYTWQAENRVLSVACKSFHSNISRHLIVLQCSAKMSLILRCSIDIEFFSTEIHKSNRRKCKELNET